MGPFFDITGVYEHWRSLRDSDRVGCVARLRGRALEVESIEQANQTQVVVLPVFADGRWKVFECHCRNEFEFKLCCPSSRTGVCNGDTIAWAIRINW